jgi:hypothetical protein
MSLMITVLRVYAPLWCALMLWMLVRVELFRLWKFSLMNRCGCLHRSLSTLIRLGEMASPIDREYIRPDPVVASKNLMVSVVSLCE